MPEPKPNEEHDAFIDRCIPIVLDEGTAKTQKQAIAICESYWDKESNIKKVDFTYKMK